MNAVHLYDYTSGSDATKKLTLSKTTTGGSNYCSLKVDAGSATTPARITLYSDDDGGASASQVKISPANSAGLSYVFDPDSFSVTHISGSNPDLGSTSNRWGNAYLSGNLDVDGSAVIDGNVTTSGNITAASGTMTAGAVVASGNLSVSGGTTLGAVTAGAIDSDEGAAIPRRHYDMPDSNSSVSWQTANIIYIASISSTRTLTLSTAGVPDGATYEVYVRRGTVTSTGVNITHRDGVAAMRYSSGGYAYAKFEVRDGLLQLMGGEYIA
jgi:hypothetical protein